MCVLLGVGEGFLLLKSDIYLLFVSFEIFQFEMYSKCQKPSVALDAFNLEQIKKKSIEESQ